MSKVEPGESADADPGIDADAEQLWLVIPVKPFDEGKSRLAPALTPAERSALARRLFEGVLAAAQTSGLFAGVAVISRDASVLNLAESGGALPIAELGSDLNDALEQARAALTTASALLVLPADLPDISAAELVAFVTVARTARMDGKALVAIAPSTTGGTNALLLEPPGVLPFVFGAEGGRESFYRHSMLAQEAGATLVVIESDALALDLDLPSDLLLVRSPLGI